MNSMAGSRMSWGKLFCDSCVEVAILVAIPICWAMTSNRFHLGIQDWGGRWGLIRVQVHYSLIFLSDQFSNSSIYFVAESFPELLSKYSKCWTMHCWSMSFQHGRLTHVNSTSHNSLRLHLCIIMCTFSYASFQLLERQSSRWAETLVSSKFGIIIYSVVITEPFWFVTIEGLWRRASSIANQ